MEDLIKLVETVNTVTSLEVILEIRNNVDEALRTLWALRREIDAGIRANKYSTEIKPVVVEPVETELSYTEEEKAELISYLKKAEEIILPRPTDSPVTESFEVKLDNAFGPEETTANIGPVKPEEKLKRQLEEFRDNIEPKVIAELTITEEHTKMCIIVGCENPADPASKFSYCPAHLIEFVGANVSMILDSWEVSP